MELRHLRYFLAVAEELHFGRAAQRLHIVQPALSKQIMSLERELGFQLFARTKRHVTFTPAGEVFHEHARAILERVDKATELARMTATGQYGKLDIGFIGPAMWTVLPPTLQEYRRNLPGVHFSLHELASSAQVRRLHDGALDVGLLRPPVHDDALTVTTVIKEPFVVGLPEDHPQASAARVDLATLANETFIFISRHDSPGFYDRCIELCRSYGFAPQTVEEGNTPAAMYGMVGASLGVTLAPTSARNGRWRGVVFRPLTRGSHVDLAFAYHTEDASPALHAFLATLNQVVAVMRSTWESGEDDGS